MVRKRVWRPVVALCTRLVTFSIKLTRTYANIMRLICSVPICSLTLYVCMTTRRSLQCVAQFSYTLVCNRYIFSSVRQKFLKFLSKIPHLLTFKI